MTYYQRGALSHHAQMDSGTITAIIGGVVAIVTVFISGLWQWLPGRKKADADAQSALVSGFVALLAEYKEREQAATRRIAELETNNQKQDRHIAKLERLAVRHNIEIPDDEPDEGGNLRRD